MTTLVSFPSRHIKIEYILLLTNERRLRTINDHGDLVVDGLYMVVDAGHSIVDTGYPVIDAGHLIVDIEYLIANHPHSIINSMRGLQNLCSCHSNLFICQLL